ncbi:MAG: hypothetical protein MUD08_05160 [Cytophagales bacterium]|nr:hypothetical protein [Cytophagales bacterium]
MNNFSGDGFLGQDEQNTLQILPNQILLMSKEKIFNTKPVSLGLSQCFIVIFQARVTPNQADEQV